MKCAFLLSTKLREFFLFYVSNGTIYGDGVVVTYIDVSSLKHLIVQHKMHNLLFIMHT